MQNRETSPQLYELGRAIPKHLIERAPEGKYGDYVPHFVIRQILLSIVGPYDWELVEILRGHVPEFTTRKGDVYPALDNAIVGAVYRLTVTIDGRVVTVNEPGACDSEAFVWNDGERLKRAASDSLKRNAMALGVGIHLWCKTEDQYFLPRVLTMAPTGDHEAPVVVGGQPEDDEDHPSTGEVPDNKHNDDGLDEIFNDLADATTSPPPVETGTAVPDKAELLELGTEPTEAAIVNLDDYRGDSHVGEIPDWRQFLTFMVDTFDPSAYPNMKLLKDHIKIIAGLGQHLGYLRSEDIPAGYQKRNQQHRLPTVHNFEVNGHKYGVPTAWLYYQVARYGKIHLSDLKRDQLELFGSQIRKAIAVEMERRHGTA